MKKEKKYKDLIVQAVLTSLVYVVLSVINSCDLWRNQFAISTNPLEPSISYLFIYFLVLNHAIQQFESNGIVFKPNRIM